MKRLTIFVVLALFIQSGVSAQPCLPDGITFNTQAHIDSFQTNNPNCTEIEGDVEINGDDITNLNGLNVLTAIGGNLIINNNSALTSLTGLDNVTSIGNDLWIYYNDALTSLTGLNNVTYIERYLGISFNDSLTSLTGLDNATSIGRLTIGGNDALTSLTGLENLEANSIEGLRISGNPYLSHCSVLSICNFLSNSNGIAEIFDNTTGCNSPEEVQDSCEANGVNIDEQLIAEKVLIYPNPSSTQITIELPHTPQKNTFLTLYNLNGQQLITQPITEPQTVVDVSGLPSGVYFVKVANDETMMMGKVIKQ